MSRLAINLFGGLSVNLDGQQITDFYSDKVRALLAYLLLEADQPQPRSKLAGLLWPNSTEQRAKHNLRQALVRLRQTIGDRDADPPFLLISRKALQWNVASDFESDVGQLAGGVSAENLPHYHSVLLDGLFIDDCHEFEEWLTIQREACRNRVLQQYEHLVASAADPTTIRDITQQWLTIDPWQEEAYRKLMRAHVDLGDMSAALAAYDKCCEVLHSELGIEPTEETRALYHEVRVSSNRIETQLPKSLTPFVGRSAEIEAVQTLLDQPSNRLITILGTGGTGKTRLALAVAERSTLPACFVPLTGIASSTDLVTPMASAIRDALGRFPLGDKSLEAALFEFLTKRPLLLVLDNFEHLLVQSGTRRFVHRLLQHCQQVVCLVTSRERLKLQAETVYRLEGLQNAEAVTCFVTYAQRQGVSVSAENQIVTSLCQLVEGMPLAIELLAAWLPILTLEEISAEVQRGLKIFEHSLIDMPSRHRSIYAVCDYSVRRLDAADRNLFHALSVFSGGFDRRAATSVAEASPLALARLLDRSLIRRDRQGRYSIHELLRQYGESHLANRVRQRHAQHFGKWLCSLEEAVLNGNKGILALIQLESSNIAAMFEWVLGNRELPLLEQLADFYFATVVSSSEYADVINKFTKAIERLDDDTLPIRLCAKLYRACGLALSGINAGMSGVQHLKHSLRLFEQIDDPTETHNTALCYAEALCYAGQYAEAHLLVGNLDEASVASGPLLRALFVNHCAASGAGHIFEARAYADRCLELSIEIDSIAYGLLGQLSMAICDLQLLWLVQADASYADRLPLPNRDSAENVQHVLQNLQNIQLPLEQYADDGMIAHWHLLTLMQQRLADSPDAAEEAYGHAVTYFQRAGYMTGGLLIKAYATSVACRFKQRKKAWRLLSEIAQMKRYPNPPYVAVILFAAAEYLLLADEPQRAANYFWSVTQMEQILWVHREFATVMLAKVGCEPSPIPVSIQQFVREFSADS